MKTSNKLLIAFAVLMFIIPLVAISYNIKVSYTDERTFKAEIKKNDHFNTTSVGFANKKVEKPFSSISIANSWGRFWEVHLVKENVSGIKVMEKYKDKIELQVDESGQLLITLKGTPVDEGFYTMVIYIYSPGVERFSIDKGDGLALDFIGHTDSLELTVGHLNNVRFSQIFNADKLSINADHVDKLELNEAKLQSLNMNLKSTQFKSERSSYGTMNISTSGESSLSISGNESKQEAFQIDQLFLNTLDKANVDIKNIQINAISGSLSDQTMVNMPAIYLKKMMIEDKK